LGERGVFQREKKRCGVMRLAEAERGNTQKQVARDLAIVSGKIKMDVPAKNSDHDRTGNWSKGPKRKSELRVGGEVQVDKEHISRGV